MVDMAHCIASSSKTICTRVVFMKIDNNTSHLIFNLKERVAVNMV